MYNWYLNSDIYKSPGRYRAFYSSNELGPIYPEITAYAISLGIILYKRKNNEIFLQRARDCAEYLISSSENGLTGQKDNIKYAFDTGIFISGLIDLYHASNEERYANEALRRLRWLCSFFDGEKFPAIVGDSSNDCWDKVSSVHLAKISIPLIKGWKTFNNENYKKIAESLLDWAIGLQSIEGRFKINYMNDSTMIHTHCYATEGFLYSSQYLNKKHYKHIAQKAIDWLAKVQNKDGSFYKWYPKYPTKTLLDEAFRIFYRTKCTDATSQAIRFWQILGIYKKNIEKGEKYLEKMRINSGLSLIKRKVLFVELKQRKVFSWPTFFYIHEKSIEFGDFSKIYEIF